MSSTKQKTERLIARVRDYQQIFSTLAGQRVLADMMQVHHMLHSSFNPKSDSETAFREGERNTVLRILTILKTKPEDLRKKIEERENDYGI